jgi:hypothetical protein
MPPTYKTTVTTQKVTPAELLARIAKNKEEIEALGALFEYSFPEFEIHSHTLRGWLNCFGFDIIVEAFEENAKMVNLWADKGIDKSVDELVSYLSGTMHNKLAEVTGVPRKVKQ